MHLLAFSAGLTALSNLLDLVGLSVDRTALANDALAMAELSFVPAVVWALLWMALAAILIPGARSVSPGGRGHHRDIGAYELVPVLFGDGFESGDTSAWSSVQQGL